MCVFCWNLLKDYMLELMVFNACILLEFIERLYAGIDGFNMCVLLELSDGLCDGVVTTCVVCVHTEICIV